MHTGRTLFAQLVQHLQRYGFQKCVARYRGDHRMRSFSYLDQLLCLVSAQLTCRESLRDIVACLRAVDGRLYHMGIRGTVSRSTLADANDARDWRIYADLAQVLIREARRLYVGEPFGVDLAQTVYAFDSTTIDLCMSLFPGAHYKRTRHAARDEAAHVAGPPGQFPHVDPHYAGAPPRCQRPRRSHTGGRGVLRDGPRLPGFRTVVALDVGGRVLRDARPQELPVRARRLPIG